MTELRTGLGPLELAVLRAVEAVTGPGHRPVATPRVLAHAEAVAGIGARHALPVMADLGVPWRVHLDLLHPGRPPLGRLALACERGERGPVPFSLIEGSAYRDGPAPPFAPWAVADALTLLVGAPAPPPSVTEPCAPRWAPRSCRRAAPWRSG